MRKPKKTYSLNEPMFHADHRRPRSRRDFLAQGFRFGGAAAMGLSLNSLLSSEALAVAADLVEPGTFTPGTCDLNPAAGGRKIPFICFDLAGGANIAGSNVLVGGPGGQRDLLGTAGYQKLGLPADLIPSNSAVESFIDDSLGLLFHSQSAMLAGIKEKTTLAAMAATNGAVIPCRSDNDTGNNPHNPMYAIYDANARGGLLQLVGSRNSVSGGNSMSPMAYINPELRPTKIDRPSDVSGLVDVGSLNSLFTESADTLAVMESVKRVSDFKLSMVDTFQAVHPEELSLKQRLSCEYLRAADTYQRFNTPDKLDPLKDPLIVGDSGIFSSAEMSDREFQKTASVMKLVIDGHAAAGTIAMGGYDYHTGDRNTGEARDLRAGRCIGACIEYAMRRQTPLMLYVYSDGSVASDGTIERMAGLGQGKCVRSGDNSSTGAAFFLVIDPAGGRPTLLDQGPADPLMHQQLGWMTDGASVDTTATPAANNVNLLVEMVVLNYLALHGEEASFAANRGMGTEANNRRYRAFSQLSSVAGGTINPPPIV